MKDFYDVWLLARQFTFDGAVLAKAIAATFKNRETAIDVAPISFTPDFTEQASTLAQWTAFRKKLPNTECPETLADVVPFLSEFLPPIARACGRGEAFEHLLRRRARGASARPVSRRATRRHRLRSDRRELSRAIHRPRSAARDALPCGRRRNVE